MFSVAFVIIYLRGICVLYSCIYIRHGNCAVVQLILLITYTQTLKDQLSLYDSQFTKLFDEGNVMISKMSEGEEPYQLMDKKLSSFEQRYTDLVTQDTGTIDTLVHAVKKVRSVGKTS